MRRTTLVGATAALALATTAAWWSDRPVRPRSGPEASRAPRRLQAPRRDLRGEPLLRQPVRRLGRGQRPSTVEGLADATPQRRRRSPRTARLRLPAAERRQPDLARRWRRPAPTRRTASPRSHFTNEPFTHRRLHRARGQDLPARPASSPPNGVLKDSPGALPGGCTRDLVHRFYQEQYQLDGGKQDRYVTGSRRGRPDHGLLRHQAAADLPVPALPGRTALRHRRPLLPGGVRRARSSTTSTSIAARAPLDTSPTTAPARAAARTPVVDAQRASPTHATRCTTPTGAGRRRAADPGLRRRARPTDAVGACGDFAVNTIQPRQPAARRRVRCRLPAHRRREVPEHRRPADRGRRLVELVLRRLGRRGGRAPRPAVPVPPPAVQLLRRLRPGHARTRPPAGRDRRSSPPRRPARCPTVSFVKPYGAENEHPGYASEPNGSDHLVDLLEAITDRPAGRATPWSS